MSKFKLLRPEEAAKRALKKVNLFKLGKAREEGVAARKKMGREEMVKLDLELIKCAMAGTPDDIKRLINAGADIDTPLISNGAPLMGATRNGGVAHVRTLLVLGAKVNARDSAGWTALMWASTVKYVLGEKLVRILLSKKAEIDMKNWRGETALHLAVDGKEEKIVSLLLEKGANPDIQDSEGKTALHLAVDGKEEKIVSLLLEKGANPDIQDSGGKTALHLAVDGKEEKIVSLLLEKGANPDIQDSEGKTTLKLAVDLGFHEIISLLLVKGEADPNVIDAYGESPVHSAYFSEDWRNSFHIENKFELEVIDMFMKNAGALLDRHSTQGNVSKVEVLLRGREERMSALDIDQINSVGNTPLMSASMHNHEKVVSLLLEKGANPDIRDKKFGRTALMFASELGYERVVSELLSAGANPDIQDEDGKTALHLAVDGKEEKIVSLLLEKGANPDIRDKKFGRTALVAAAFEGSEKIVAELLNAGIDENSVQLIEALEAAIVSSNEATVRLLLEKQTDWNSMERNFYDLEDKSRSIEPGITELVKQRMDLLKRNEQVERGEIGGGVEEAPAKKWHKKLISELIGIWKAFSE